MDVLDRAVLQTIAGDLLTPRVITRATRLVLETYDSPNHEADMARLEGEVASLVSQTDRLAEAIATGGNVPTLLEKLRAKQARLDAVRMDLAALRTRQSVHVDLRALERELAGRLGDWRRVLFGNIREARTLLRKLLDGPIQFTPKVASGKQVYQYRGRLAIGEVVSGLVDLPMNLASPTGFEPVFWP